MTPGFGGNQVSVLLLLLPEIKYTQFLSLRCSSEERAVDLWIIVAMPLDDKGADLTENSMSRESTTVSLGGPGPHRWAAAIHSATLPVLMDTPHVSIFTSNVQRASLHTS